MIFLDTVIKTKYFLILLIVFNVKNKIVEFTIFISYSKNQSAALHSVEPRHIQLFGITDLVNCEFSPLK